MTATRMHGRKSLATDSATVVIRIATADVESCAADVLMSVDADPLGMTTKFKPVALVSRQHSSKMEPGEKRIYKELEKLYKKKQRLSFLVKEQKDVELLLDMIEGEIEDLEGLLYYMGARPCYECSCFHRKDDCFFFSS